MAGVLLRPNGLSAAPWRKRLVLNFARLYAVRAGASRDSRGFDRPHFSSRGFFVAVAARMALVPLEVPADSVKGGGQR